MPRASERQNQDEAPGAVEDQGSQGTFQSEELTSFISSKLQELLSSNGVAALAARYDGRAGIASRKCLEVPPGHFGYATRVENGSNRTTMEKPMRFQEYMLKHRSKLIDAEQQWMEALCDFCAVSKLSEEEAIKFITNFMDSSHRLMLDNLPEEEKPENLEDLFNRAVVPFMPSVHTAELDAKLRNLKQDPEKDIQDHINQHAKLERQLKLSSPDDQVRVKCSSSAQSMRLLNSLHQPFVSFVTKVFETENRAKDWPTDYHEVIPLLTHYWPVYRSQEEKRGGKVFFQEGKRTGAPAFDRNKDSKSKAGEQIVQSREYLNSLPEEKQAEVRQFISTLKKARSEAREAGTELDIKIIKEANDLNVCIKCSNVGHLIRACLQHQGRDKKKPDQTRQRASA